MLRMGTERQKAVFAGRWRVNQLARSEKCWSLNRDGGWSILHRSDKILTERSSGAGKSGDDDALDRIDINMLRHEVRPRI
jgi:hypothetical protein